MTQEFNIVRYIELLKDDQELRSQNSSLYKEDKVKKFELLSYEMILYNQIIYNRKDEYIPVIEQYVSKKIDDSSLISQLFAIQEKDSGLLDHLENNFEELSKVLIDSKSNEFGVLIQTIFETIEFVGDDMSKSEFWSFMEKTFLQIEKIFK